MVTPVSALRAWSPMTRSALCAAALAALASVLSAQAPAPAPARRIAPSASSAVPRPVAAHSPKPAAAPPATYQKYCYECHGTKNPEAGLSIEKLVGQFSIGAHWQQWEKVADMLDSGMMPPIEADAHPTDG